MSKSAKIIHIIVFCIWAALLSVLLYKHYTGTSLEKKQILEASFHTRTYWYDIYRGTKKIGFAETAFEKAGDEIIIKHSREMKVKAHEEERSLIEKLKTLCDLSYSIKSFEFTSNIKNEKGYKLSGEVENSSIIFLLESPEKRKTYKISTGGKDFYLPIMLIPVIHQKNPLPNTPFVVPLLDIASLSIDEVSIVLEEIRPLKVGINILSLYRFRVADTIIWSNEKGIVIKEKSPSGITLYSQVEKIANNADDKILFDYTSLPFFKSNKLIEDTEKLSRLKLKIHGLSPSPELYEKSLITTEKDILIIEKQDVGQLKNKTYTLPYGKDKFNRYLSPDEWVQSNIKAFKDTGRITASARNNNAFLFAQYLTGYLYNIIRTMPMFVLSDSQNIQKSLLGDFVERTVMFATYARAGGLPTRLIGGLVYVNGYFYFHTWPEVWFDRWVPLDPTFVQFPADVTHIPLTEGTLTDIVSIIDDLKDIKIEILETS